MFPFPLVLRHVDSSKQDFQCLPPSQLRYLVFLLRLSIRGVGCAVSVWAPSPSAFLSARARPGPALVSFHWPGGFLLPGWERPHCPPHSPCSLFSTELLSDVAPQSSVAQMSGCSALRGWRGKPGPAIWRTREASQIEGTGISVDK